MSTRIDMMRHGDAARYAPYARRLLIEAIEGCGIRHWAHVESWDGVSVAVISDLGGETFELTTVNVVPFLAAYADRHGDWEPMEIDSYLADELIQEALFGGVISRTQVRRRPVLVA